MKETIGRENDNISEDEEKKARKERKKSEKYWGQRRNGWAGAVMVSKGGNGGQ